MTNIIQENGQTQAHSTNPLRVVARLRPLPHQVDVVDDVDIEAGVSGAGEKDEAIGVGVRETGLAGFDAELEGRIVLDPGDLGGVEVGGEGSREWSDGVME